MLAWLVVWAPVGTPRVVFEFTIRDGKVVAEACFSNPVGGNTSYCPSGAPSSIGPGTVAKLSVAKF